MQNLLLAIALSFSPCQAAETTTPIKHLVVIFQENVSFDHYFATYPNALNKKGEPQFHPSKGTPTVNGLSGPLLSRNQNAVPPFRLDRDHSATCDQSHEYQDEQKAYHGGLMDRFVESTGESHGGCDPKIVMSYFDGNTVTALWNYAQHYAMSDNSFGTTFGPSTPGAINLASGQTYGAVPADLKDGKDLVSVSGALVGDADPEFDDCSDSPTVRMTGRNIGDLLSAKGISWGWFEGGFRPTLVTPGKAICGAAHKGADGKNKHDYIPHHEPFQYYSSTANRHHLPPTSAKKIGLQDQANHQYDLEDFWDAIKAGRMPAVSFLKAPGYQDGHAGYSDPISEQAFLVETLNGLQRLPQWKNTAVVIAYDDSDGWYDHAMPPVVRQSSLAGADALLGPDSCGVGKPGEYPGRCGYGPRLPLLVVSPYARKNFVDHSVTDQTSITNFVEDNWKLGRIGDQSYDEDAGTLLSMFDFARAPRADKLVLDPKTGQPKR